MTVIELIEELMRFQGDKRVYLDSSFNEYLGGIDTVVEKPVVLFSDESQEYDVEGQTGVVLVARCDCPAQLE